MTKAGLQQWMEHIAAELVQAASFPDEPEAALDEHILLLMHNATVLRRVVSL
jgi:hypothetical protein